MYTEKYFRIVDQILKNSEVHTELLSIAKTRKHTLDGTKLLKDTP